MTAYTGTKTEADKVLIIGEKVEIALEGEETTAKSSIESMQGDKLVLAAPVDENDFLVAIAPGERLVCKLAGNACFYRFEAVCLGRAAEGSTSYVIERPEYVYKAQHREFVRTEVDHVLIVRPLRGGSTSNMIFAKMADLSGGGLAMIVDEPLKVDSKAVLEFADIPGLGMLRITGLVRRCVKLGAVGNSYKVGVQFLDLSHANQEKLVKFVFDLQRQSLAKGIGKK